MSQHTVTVADNAIALDDQQDRQVDIRITSAKLEEHACPETVVRLIVEHQKGEQAIFFVSVRLSMEFPRKSGQWVNGYRVFS